MGEITTEMILILLLIVANGIFAMIELAIVSSRKVRLKNMIKNGNKNAGIALKLAEEPNTFLSASQIGITLIGILSGALGGATLSDNLRQYFLTVPILAEYAHALSIGIIVIVITYFSLVIGELVPKRLALNNPEKIASRFARLMKILSTINYPLIKILSFSTDLFLKILMVKPSKDQPVTEEEVRVLIQQGTVAGVFEEVEKDMIERIFRLGDKTVNMIMQQRMEIEWIDLEDEKETIREKIRNSRHSRLPVCDGSPDSVSGIIEVKEVLASGIDREDFDIKPFIEDALIVPESMHAIKAVKVFRESGHHIAIVVNEYGGTEGLLTLIDLVEAIVGEISSPEEQNEPMVFKRDENSLLIDGMLPVDELKEQLQVSSLPYEDTAGYQTIGGLVLAYLGKIPAVGEKFTWDRFTFEVVDMDGRRIDKVLVTIEKPPADYDDSGNE